MSPECPGCVSAPPPFTATLAPLLLQAEVRRWISQLKYQANYVVAQVLAAILADQATGARPHLDWPDLLLPVPSTRLRLLRRGHNPAARIAAGLGRRLHLPVNFRAVRRGRQTSQVGLTRADREDNLTDAFVVPDAYRAARIAIVDDVMTTGATARALASALLDAGAGAVQVWVAARTPALRMQHAQGMP
jgi:ComF family protein